MNHRIRQIRENLHLSRTEFGKRIGVSGDVINNLERGRVEIRDHIVKLICCEYNINEAWLRTGEGNADKPMSREGEDELAKYMELLLRCEPNDIRRRFVLAVSHLSSDQLDVFANIARQLVDELKVQPDTSGENPDTTTPPSDTAAYYVVPYYRDFPASAGVGLEAGTQEPEELLLTKKPPRGTTYVTRVRGNSMEPSFYDDDKVFVQHQDAVEVGQIGIFWMDNEQFVKELGENELISHNSQYKPKKITPDIKCQGRVLGICDDSYFTK